MYGFANSSFNLDLKLGEHLIIFERLRLRLACTRLCDYGFGPLQGYAAESPLERYVVQGRNATSYSSKEDRGGGDNNGS